MPQAKLTKVKLESSRVEWSRVKWRLSPKEAMREKIEHSLLKLLLDKAEKTTQKARERKKGEREREPTLSNNGVGKE